MRPLTKALATTELDRGECMGRGRPLRRDRLESRAPKIATSGTWWRAAVETQRSRIITSA
jgi:hypothetical protein